MNSEHGPGKLDECEMMNDRGEEVQDQSTGTAICYSAVTNVFLMNLHPPTSPHLPDSSAEQGLFLKAGVTPIYPVKQQNLNKPTSARAL